MSKLFFRYIEYFVVLVIFYFNLDAALSSDNLFPFKQIFFIIQGVMFVVLYKMPKLYRFNVKILIFLIFTAQNYCFINTKLRMYIKYFYCSFVINLLQN